MPASALRVYSCPDLDCPRAKVLSGSNLRSDREHGDTVTIWKERREEGRKGGRIFQSAGYSSLRKVAK